MKNAFTFLTLLLAASFTFGQAPFPNGDFEPWDIPGTTGEEPVNWNGNKTGGGLAAFGPQTCFQDDVDFHGGLYSVRLETDESFGTPVNGTISTGQIQAPSADPMDGYVITDRADTSFHFVFSDRPDSVVGWIKYSPTNNDSAKIQIYLHGDYDVRNPLDGPSTPFIIGEATYYSGAVANWTRISFPFTYLNGTAPNYMLGVITSSASPANAQVGSTFWVDDFEFIYLPVVALDDLEAQNIKVYSGNSEIILEAENAGFSKETSFELLDIHGKVVLHRELTNEKTYRFENSLPAGVYLYRIMNDHQMVSGRMARMD